MFNLSTVNLSSRLTCSLKTLLVAFMLINVNLAIAEETAMVTIPAMSDARVFAEFTDETPAVINYFTKSTEEEVIQFYQKEYGQALNQERKRGRLTLNFNQKQHSIRVVISQQNKLRQVDVIVEENSNN
ncbi:MULTISPECIES: hypothetical protein [unclassified Colwellia]|uniref:hypothetical protein n=1 Tax=unclassified Colwellia TaxID=196834 RepID=UPI0015F38BB0|nr:MULTISPECIES: hypothetical protein [unclassified Colwellia]MBA6380644.1 hypothetical protein [Colwellia sp. BRX10-7]MBA6387989.1 hypothetical protein [Colwellia sp. BRX10-2]MBA6402048.1 hypothetical protein [Colwellia sp. BRX10-5]MBA6406396.1 hypothetical protein [Colwellia sp. BRX10-1]